MHRLNIKSKFDIDKTLQEILGSFFRHWCLFTSVLNFSNLHSLVKMKGQKFEDSFGRRYGMLSNKLSSDFFAKKLLTLTQCPITKEHFFI
jgi:hypothetical protein